MSTTSALHLQGEELWLAVLAYQSSFVYAGIQHQVAAVLAEGEVGELNAPPRLMVLPALALVLTVS